MTQAALDKDPQLLNALQWRCIGPPRGGRVVAVAGDPLHPAVFYFGACAGGVWKTDDGGTYWHNISDDVCAINQPFCEQCALFFPYALFLSLPIHPSALPSPYPSCQISRMYHCTHR
jgi:hypothetical protein